MPIQDQITEDVGAPPSAPGYLDYWFNNAKLSDYERRSKIYDAAAAESVRQRMNPVRDVRLGDAANFLHEQPASIAEKGQYTDRTVSEPSGIPRYQFAPTMMQGPEAQGPYDIRQEPDVNGRPSPIERQYVQSPDVPQTPQVRQPMMGLSMQEAGPAQSMRDVPTLQSPDLRLPSRIGSSMAPLGAFEPQQGPAMSYNKQDVNLEAPTTLFQQQRMMSELHRDSLRPYGSGASGAGRFEAEVQARAQAYMQAFPDMSEAEARSKASADKTGGSFASNKAKLENTEAGTSLRGTREADITNRQNLREREFTNLQRHQKLGEDIAAAREHRLGLYQERMQHAMDNKDWIAVARLNEQRSWHDFMSKVYLAADKAGIVDDDIQKAIQQDLISIDQLHERDLQPDELDNLRQLGASLGIATPQKAYTYKSRPPIQAPQQGPAPMARPSAAPVAPSATTGTAPSDADYEATYNKLPSGSKFVGPDGIPRVKP